MGRERPNARQVQKRCNPYSRRKPDDLPSDLSQTPWEESPEQWERMPGRRDDECSLSIPCSPIQASPLLYEDSPPRPKGDNRVGFVPPGVTAFAYKGCKYSVAASEHGYIVECEGHPDNLEISECDTYEPFEFCPFFAVPLTFNEVATFGMFNRIGTALLVDNRAIVGIQNMDLKIEGDRVCTVREPCNERVISSFYLFIINGAITVYYLTNPQEAYIAFLQQDFDFGNHIHVSTNAQAYKNYESGDVILHDPARVCDNCDRIHEYHYYTKEAIERKFPTLSSMGILVDRNGHLQYVGGKPSASLYGRIGLGRISCVAHTTVVCNRMDQQVVCELATGTDHFPANVEKTWVVKYNNTLYLIERVTNGIIGVLKKIPHLPDGASLRQMWNYYVENFGYVLESANYDNPPSLYVLNDPSRAIYTHHGGSHWIEGLKMVELLAAIRGGDQIGVIATTGKQPVATPLALVETITTQESARDLVGKIPSEDDPVWIFTCSEYNGYFVVQNAEIAWVQNPAVFTKPVIREADE